MPSGDSIRRRACLALSDLMVVVVGLCLGLFVQLPVGVSGHGYLSDPPSRSSAWRLGFDNPTNYNDNELNCGGFARQWTQNGGRCGVCGDPWDARLPRPNEVGGKFANGIIVHQYPVGHVVVMSVTITAQHKGWFEFRLCPGNESPDAPTTQECLDANLLEVKDGGQKTRYQMPSNASRGIFNVKVKLPEGLVCTHCVLQWKWHVGNSWGIGSDGAGCFGCGPQEEFINCADISISSAPKPASPSHKSSSPTSASLSPKSHSRSQSPRSSRTPRPITTLSPIVSASSTTSKSGKGKTSSTMTSPAVVSSKSSAPGCHAIGSFEGNPDMDVWCVANCALNFCPPTHCKCSEGASAADGGVTKCKSIGIWTSATMDRWCVSNCAAGYCPSDFCQCYESPEEK